MFRQGIFLEVEGKSVWILFSVAVIGRKELTDWTLLYDYKDFGSSSPFFHTVPELASEATWGYQVDKYPEDCENKNVTV